MIHVLWDWACFSFSFLSWKLPVSCSSFLVLKGPHWVATCSRPSSCLTEREMCFPWELHNFSQGGDGRTSSYLSPRSIWEAAPRLTSFLHHWERNQSDWLWRGLGRSHLKHGIALSCVLCVSPYVRLSLSLCVCVCARACAWKDFKVLVCMCLHILVTIFVWKGKSSRYPLCADSKWPLFRWVKKSNL